MSFNRLHYDQNTYKRQLSNNVTILDYLLNPLQYEHDNKCRHELGLVGGANVSHVDANLVDLESELRGQTHFLSKCGTNRAAPLSTSSTIQNDKTQPISTSLKHLPACQMISYASVPTPPPMRLPKLRK